MKFPQTIPPDELDATLDDPLDEADETAEVVVDEEPVVTDVPVPLADVFVMDVALVLVAPGPEGPALFVDEVVPGAPPSPP